MGRLWLVSCFLLSFVFILPAVAATITIETGSTCNAGETCLFSLWNLTNSHVGACGYYTNYTVCTNEVTSVATRQNSCNVGEGTLLSFFQINNTHIGDYSQFQYKLCATPSNYTCAFESGSCKGGQTCAGSAYSNANAHFGQCGYFQYQICCGSDNTPPVITNQTINATEVAAKNAVRFTANVTDDFNVNTVIVTVLDPSGFLQNYTMGLLSGDLYYLDYTNTLQNGAYTWTETYANDTSNNWATSNPNLQFIVAGVNYTISGNVFDAISGQLISSGNVTAIIEQTGESGTGTITNGVFSVQVQSYLNANLTSFNVGLIATGNGKTGYREYVFGTGPFAQQVAACSSKTYQFQGVAIDPNTGQTLQSGSITALFTVGTQTITNTTNFSSGQWGVSLTGCTIPGGLYPINLILNSGGETTQNTLNVVAS